MVDLKNNPMLVRQVIMDHYEYPRNHGLKEDTHYRTVHMASDSCIDDIKVQLNVEDNLIKDVCFDGVACTISTASTSILTELIKGKTLEEAKHILLEYTQMIFEKEHDENLLEEAVVFENVSKQANRINCALIGAKGLSQLIEQIEQEGS